MSTPKDINKGVEKLIGTAWWDVVQMLYLMAKYQENCIFLPVSFEPMTEGEYKYFSSKPFGGFVSLTWDCLSSESCKLKGPNILGGDLKRYSEMLVECAEGSARLVVIPLEMHSKGRGHANMLIYDKETGTVERFEPNGKGTPDGFDDGKMDRFLKRYFELIFKRDIKYMKPVDFCPRYGAQMVENAAREALGVPMKRGLCSVWSFIYANYRLRFPSKSREDIAQWLASSAQKVVQNPTDDSTLYHFAVEIVRMLAYLSQRLRSAKTMKEIEEVLIKATKMLGAKF